MLTSITLHEQYNKCPNDVMNRYLTRKEPGRCYRHRALGLTGREPRLAGLEPATVGSRLAKRRRNYEQSEAEVFRLRTNGVDFLAASRILQRKRVK